MKKQILTFIILSLFVFFFGAQEALAGSGKNIPYRVYIDDEELLEDDPDFLENQPSWQLKSYSVYPNLQRYRSDKNLKVIKFKAVFEYTGDTLEQSPEGRPVIGIAMCKVPDPYYFFETKIVYKGPLPLQSGEQVASTVLIPFPAKIAAQLRKNPATCGITIENENSDFPVSYWFEVKRSGRIFKMTFNGTNTDQAPPLENTEPTVTEPTTLPTVQQTLPPVTSQDHIRGNKNATVTLVEYSDPDCPFCKRFHPTMKQVLANYGDKVRWVYRHFPLTMLHPDAHQKAEASECANELGGEETFWQFMDQLLEAEPAEPELANTAVALGLNRDLFNECLTSGRYKKLVDEHYKGGEQSGVAGTPSTFLIRPDGTVDSITGAQPYETVAEAVEKALQTK